MSATTNTLNRDYYCGECWDNITTGVGDDKIRALGHQLWCRRCQTTHPALCFSRAGRQHAQNSGTNVGSGCILTTGGISVCKHRCISFREMRAWEANFGGPGLRRLGGTVTPQAFTPWECKDCIKMIRHDEPKLPPECRPPMELLWPYTNTHYPKKEQKPPPEPTFPVGAKQPRLRVETSSALGRTPPRIIKSWAIPIFKGRSGSMGISSIDYKKVHKALTLAGEGFTSLICGHAKFTDDAFWSILTTLSARTVIGSSSCTDVPPRGCDWAMEDWSEQAPSNIWRRLPDGTGYSRPIRCMQCGAEYRWLNKSKQYLIEGRHDLSACFHSRVPVMGISIGFISAMNPNTYRWAHGRDWELKCVSWCSKKSCSVYRYATAHLNTIKKALLEAEGDLPPYEAVGR